MSKLSVKRSFSQFFIAIASGIFLIFIGLYVSGLWKQWFGRDEPKIVIRNEPKTDTVVLIKEDPKNRPKSDSISTQTENFSPTQIKTQDRHDAIDLINKSVKADIAVFATSKGKKDNHLTSAFINWLKNNGAASQSIIQSPFIETDYFNQVIDGKPKVIINTSPAQSAKHLCLIRASITYKPSEVDNSLIVAVCRYEIVIVDATTGYVIDSLDESIKSSGISEEMAKQRVEEEFFKYLSKRKLTL